MKPLVDILTPEMLPPSFRANAERMKLQPVQYHGRVYPSFTALAYASKLTPTQVRDRLAHGQPLEPRNLHAGSV